MSDDLLFDGFERRHDNLRISVTDRCNIRCFYCMPAENVVFMQRKHLLSFEEITRFVRIVAKHGVRKLRLTGGEPLVRRDLPELVKMLAEVPGIEDIGLTTNGILLAGEAQSLFDAGLRRINISLDALDPKKFEEITRREGYERVIEGIQAARDAGFTPIKINAVSIRGLTEDQIVPFGRFARESGVEVRFIEFMPLDADGNWERKDVLFASEIVTRLSESIRPLLPLPNNDPTAPATDYEFDDGIGRVGFIPSVSQPFCGSCNRFRITADGKLRNCLFSLDETDIKSLLRDGADDERIIGAVRQCLNAKWAGHQINSPDFVQPDRPMYSIGG